mmetsp:Transcript_120515/g.375264  ORF Transcript_120515/g.375264 Transcript_120515/m.375264 type:complete len:99 (-) Transcript_120515:15-311(-)
MSAQDLLAKAGVASLMAASEKSCSGVDSFGGCASSALGSGVRSGVPLPGLNKVAPGTLAIFSSATGSASGLTRGQLQSKRIGSDCGPGVVPRVWLAQM